MLPAQQLVEEPQHVETRRYVKECKEIEEMSKGKNLLNVYYSGKSIFSS